MRFLFFLLLFLALFASLPRSSAQAITDPLDVQVLKNLSAKYQITEWSFQDDPCGQKGQSIFVGYMKCVCTYNNGSTCHVVEIYIYEKGLRGTFPMDVFNLKYLTRLDLGHNYLYGTLPSELGMLTGLIHFAVGTNQFSGSIPKEIGNITGLLELYLDSNYFTGNIPPELGKLTMLQKLWLLDNNMTGPIPDIFESMKSLQELRIYGNNFEGQIPRSIQNLTSITSLYIADVKNGGMFPSDLENLKNLTYLSLRNNGLTGSIPDYLSKLPNLLTLDLTFNYLTGSIPTTLGDSPSLTRLYLGSNNLTGFVPENLLESKTLTSLDLSFNNLEGNLSNWPQVSDALQLNLVWNSFTGSLAHNLSRSRLILQDCARNNTCGETELKNSGFAINIGGTTYGEYEMDDTNMGFASYYTNTKETWLSSVSGSTTILTSTVEINGSSDKQLYVSARQTLGSLRYFGLGMLNGKYVVEIHYAEIAFASGSLGRRIFDVYIQGNLMVKDFNIQQAANGSYKAFTHTFIVNISNNLLDIHFLWAGKGTCCIPNYDSSFGPLVSALHVYSDSISENSESQLKGVAVAGICVGALIFILLCVFLLWRKLRKESKQTKNSEINFEGNLTIYPYNELRVATNDFHPDRTLGEGGFGTVYKGILQDGSIVAVKVLFKSSKQGKPEFLNEISLITSLQHRNLVRLKGYCLEGDKAVLVYEYLEGGSLDNVLFESSEASALDWGTRFNIIVGVARGLAYLHEESHTQIVHRDIKASNILLDNKLQPKISDFGLARLFTEDASHVTTHVAGTWGYVAPEYAIRGKLTVKADVYSYGILILEIVSGRKNREPKAEAEKEFLLDWVWNSYGNGNLLDIRDRRMKGEYGKDEMLRVMCVALLCLQPGAEMRPSMSKVVAMLLGEAEMPSLPTMKPVYLSEVSSTTHTTKKISDASSSSNFTLTSTSTEPPRSLMSISTTSDLSAR